MLRRRLPYALLFLAAVCTVALFASPVSAQRRGRVYMGYDPWTGSSFGYTSNRWVTPYSAPYGYGYSPYGYDSGYYYRPGFRFSTGRYWYPSDGITYSTAPTVSTDAGYYGSVSGSPNMSLDPNSVTIDVRVPPNAEIWFEGQKTQQMGSLRRFISPPLEPGKEYTYEIRASWMGENGQPQEQKRQINVHAGERQTLDLLVARSSDSGQRENLRQSPRPSSRDNNKDRNQGFDQNQNQAPGTKPPGQ